MSIILLHVHVLHLEWIKYLPLIFTLSYSIYFTFSSHRFCLQSLLVLLYTKCRDCDTGLVCGQRSGTEAVNGCVGSGISGKDYCHVPPPPTDSPTRAPTPLCLEIGEDCSQSAESECCSGVCVGGLCGSPYPPLTYVGNEGTNYNVCEGKLSDELFGASVSL